MKNPIKNRNSIENLNKRRRQMSWKGRHETKDDNKKKINENCPKKVHRKIVAKDPNILKAKKRLLVYLHLTIMPYEMYGFWN